MCEYVSINDLFCCYMPVYSYLISSLMHVISMAHIFSDVRFLNLDVVCLVNADPLFTMIFLMSFKFRMEGV